MSLFMPFSICATYCTLSAMVPLDGRLKAAEDWGLCYLLELADLRTVLPMHQWEDCSPTERFLQKHPEWAGRILPVTQEGQSWEL